MARRCSASSTVRTIRRGWLDPAEREVERGAARRVERDVPDVEHALEQRLG